MKRERRTFDRSFKLEVVRRSLEQTTVKELSEELQIHKGVISRWRKEFLDSDEVKVLFPGKGVEALTDDEKRIKQLELALKDKDLELEILKKAISIFSKKDRISTNSLK